jgi:hypothetical protein
MWLMVEMSESAVINCECHEQVMIRLREEIASVMGDSTHPTKEQVRKMPYLSCVIKESKYPFPPISILCD